MAKEKGGRRYPLVIYTHMIKRWWTAVFTLGLALLGLSWAVYSWGMDQWRWLALASIGGLHVFIGPGMWLMRKSAYVQPFREYLKLVTPFLRLNISYRRVRRATSANMGTLFPPNSVSSWRAEIIQPLAKMTAIVIEMNSHPMPQSQLRLFLSPLFFKDKSPHIVILVDDWMKFSSEMDSLRTGTGPISAQQKRNASILSRLPNKDK